MSYESSNYTTEKVEISLIYDKEHKGYTAISKQFPESVSEGNTKGEAIKNFGKMISLVDNDVPYEPIVLDNFDNIIPLLDFSLPNTMYFIQVLQRRKDNPGLKTDVRTINNYYIYELADLIKLKTNIAEDCIKYNARAYINLNRLNSVDIALNTVKVIAELMLKGQFKQIKNAYTKSCGSYHSEEDEVGEGSKKTFGYNSEPNKKWVVDIDTKVEAIIEEIISFIESLYKEAKSGNKILARIPTKNGVHLICEGFHLDKFSKKYGGITVGKNSPTILFIKL